MMCYIGLQDTFNGAEVLLRGEAFAPETIIPDWYNYLFDGGIHSISDGGNDMYDGGNFVRVMHVKRVT